MDFRSDNVAGAPPEILDALVAAAKAGPESSYGEDRWTARLQTLLSELFEREVKAFPVITGGAANGLALAAFTPPWGSIYCHEESHVQTDECGGPELLTGGAKLQPMPGAHGRIVAGDLAARLARSGQGVVHHVQPAAVSITQATEAGTCYRPAEIAAIAEVAKRHGLALHMDGARFANAAAFLGASPAELTWKAGVDALSFGMTKDGALAAEAVVFFDPAKAETFPYIRKRAGHLLSKMRFISAQLVAGLEEGRWLGWARHANAMAKRLSEGLAAVPGATLAHPVEANEIFVVLPVPTIEALMAGGYRFYRWSELGDGRALCRLVTCFATTEAEVDGLLAAARRAAGKAAAD